MKATPPLRFARLLQVVRTMEEDLGVGELNKAEKKLFTCVADLCSDAGSSVNLIDILAHDNMKKMPQATAYKCLRDLRDKGLLIRVGGQGSGVYRLG
jgi:hypothetical protein